MDKNDNIDEAATLVKGGSAAIMGGILAICQSLSQEPAVVFGLGIANAIMPNVIDYGARCLSLNERRRIDHVESFTLQEILVHLREGHEPRRDGFLNINPEVRSSAQELCEGVLELARTEYQEAKLPHMAYLYASILFANTVPPNEANRLIRVLNALSYQEMCILAALSQETAQDGLRKNSFSHEKGTEEFSSLMQECFKLEGQSLLFSEDDDQGPSFGKSTWAHMVPAKIRVTEHGMKLIRLSKLSEIPETYTRPIRETLSG